MKTGLTRPIPKAAMLVVEVLRRDIKKPSDLPKSENKDGNCLHWNFNNPNLFICPMGLHPKARHVAPDTKKEFPIDGISGANILSFAKWWDAQVDPTAAVSAVWPK